MGCCIFQPAFEYCTLQKLVMLFWVGSISYTRSYLYETSYEVWTFNDINVMECSKEFGPLCAVHQAEVGLGGWRLLFQELGSTGNNGSVKNMSQIKSPILPVIYIFLYSNAQLFVGYCSLIFVWIATGWNFVELCGLTVFTLFQV